MADTPNTYGDLRLLSQASTHRKREHSTPTVWKPDFSSPLVIGNDAATGTAQLVRAIETEVLPRLLLARRHGLAADGGVAQTSPAIGGPADVSAFTELVLEKGMAAASFIDALRDRRVPVDQILLRLLAPAARRLGDLWVEDLVDFTQVTIGVGHLQLLLRHLGMGAFDESGAQHRTGRILLLPAAGEQHSFGLIMVAEFFRRAGWDVTCSVGVSAGDAVALVREQAFSILGVSLSSETHLDAVTQQIRAMRRASRNRALGTLVGGHVFYEHPEFVSMVGADATATDGRQAVAQAETMLGLLAISC
jgi:methanogenic corrinoid protein MtbC1